jgi:hypothetical protein
MAQKVPFSAPHRAQRLRIRRARGLLHQLAVAYHGSLKALARVHIDPAVEFFRPGRAFRHPLPLLEHDLAHLHITNQRAAQRSITQQHGAQRIKGRPHHESETGAALRPSRVLPLEKAQTTQPVRARRGGGSSTYVHVDPEAGQQSREALSMRSRRADAQQVGRVESCRRQ